MAYTVEELKAKIEKTKKNPMLTDGQKSQLLEKYNKDIEALEGETPKVEDEPKKIEPTIIAVKGASGKGKSYAPSKEECEEIIKEASLKAKKAKVSAAKSAKKSPVVKNKEKIEKVEESVMERVESGKATKTEIISMIAKLEAVLKKLNKALSKL